MRPDGIGNGGVIVDVGLWDFLEVSYRPKADLYPLEKQTFKCLWHDKSIRARPFNRLDVPAQCRGKFYFAVFSNASSKRCTWLCIRWKYA